MESPAEMIRRAAGKRPQLPMQKGQRTGEAAQEPPALPPPRPISRHGSYTALMRSHDRVHTRHIRG